jgi:formylglycine-generating enzyme required for sulfatase activity
MPLRNQFILTRLQKSPAIRRLEQQPAGWMLATGMVLGTAAGTVALFGIGGVVGVLLCLLVLGVALLLGVGAQPVVAEPVRPVTAKGEQPVLKSEPPVPEPEPEEPPLRIVEDIPGLLEMVELLGGAFLMGSPDTDEQAYGDEKPQHEVTVSRFAMSRFLVTRKLYREIMGQGPSEWQRDQNDDRLPANYVSWFEAVDFCNALSQRQSLQPCYRRTGDQVEWDHHANGYRLPTEAEWEYAVRAGTTTRWFCGDEPAELGKYAWFSGNSGDRVQPVGEKEPNSWGFYDLAGNVWEWCWDGYDRYSPDAVINPVGAESAGRRVLRGGAYWDEARDLRSAYRDGDVPVGRDVVIGFRCVRAARRQL